jgi:hypothetical protein
MNQFSYFNSWQNVLYLVIRINQPQSYVQLDFNFLWVPSVYTLVLQSILCAPLFISKSISCQRGFLISVNPLLKSILKCVCRLHLHYHTTLFLFYCAQNWALVIYKEQTYVTVLEHTAPTTWLPWSIGTNQMISGAEHLLNYHYLKQNTTEVYFTDSLQL